MTAKQSILPIFLPMAGCGRACVYCDQRAISGEAAAPGLEQVRAQLAAFGPDAEAELAYYGGSFTCLPREQQQAWLDLARPAIAEGRIRGVRVSTRPDAVDAETCAFLKQNGVVTVELGVQSFDDGVLAAAGRGCTAAQNWAACAAVRQAGLTLGVQLMTGLPGDTPALARASMREAIALGAQLLRVYPTLVLKDTQLAADYQAGTYQPQSLAEAVALGADLLTLCLAADRVMLRMGVNPGPAVEAALVAGPYHPAFGGLVREELWGRLLAQLLADFPEEEVALLRFHKDDLPLLFGQGRRRMAELGAKYPCLALIPDSDVMPRGELSLFAESGERRLNQRDYCQQAAAALGE